MQQDDRVSRPFVQHNSEWFDRDTEFKGNASAMLYAVRYHEYMAAPLLARIAELEAALAECNVAVHNMTTFPETYTDDMYNDWIFGDKSPIQKALEVTNTSHPVVPHPLLGKETSEE